MIKQTHIILLFRRVIEFRRVFGISVEEETSFVEGKTENLKIFSLTLCSRFPFAPSIVSSSNCNSAQDIRPVEGRRLRQTILKGNPTGKDA